VTRAQQHREQHREPARTASDRLARLAGAVTPTVGIMRTKTRPTRPSPGTTTRQGT